ncbi:MAG: hypothetical protein KME57_33945 [Scytonema hyalinum WJT4-NPBG1]|jgi:hypothetical protein|nr:hypothetical protein [Scytonema hyalinum WJT4-NPBG1]
MRTGESSPVGAACPKGLGGFPSVGNWLSRWGERFEMVIVKLESTVQEYTDSSNPKAVMVHKYKAVLEGRGFRPKFSMKIKPQM